MSGVAAAAASAAGSVTTSSNMLKIARFGRSLRFNKLVARKLSTGEYKSPIEQWSRSGPMWQEQRNVARLPLPTLTETADRYLEYLDPLISENDHSNTTMIVEEFVNGEGAQLHRELEALDKESEATEGSYGTSRINYKQNSDHLQIFCREKTNVD
jgi:hypothetical protein